jgi:hypothetical protein
VIALFYNINERENRAFMADSNVISQNEKKERN